MTTEEFNILVENSQPNEYFSLDWETYYPVDFADTFLPKVSNLECTGVKFFDGANLLYGIKTSQNKLVTLTESNKIINLVTNTFPKGVEAGLKKTRVAPANNEIVTFIEVDQTDDAIVSFKFGNDFRDFAAKENTSIQEIEQTDFESNIANIQNHFNNSLSHLNMMSFVFKTIGLEEPTDIENKIFEEFEKTFKVLEDDFGAGRVKEKHPNAFAHGDIEDIALKKAGFSESQIEQVYYGNWLRDFSQVIVADTVGFNQIDQNFFREFYIKNKRVQDLIPSMSCKPSQQAWVNVIKILAVKEFIYNPKKKNGQIPTQNFKKHEDEFERIFGKLTKDILGIYRPEEHLDNPKGLKDDSVFADKRLQQPIQFNYEFAKNKFKIKKLYNGEKSLSLEIDDEKLMKRFLIGDIFINNQEDRPSSFSYLKEQLRLAQQKGKNRDGLRHFGAALHVIEDYYAHTNFIELSLIKVGKTKVFPWVQIDKEIDEIEDGAIKASKIPIVSGLFGSDDTIASITPKLAEELFPLGFQEYQSIEENERTFFDSLVLTILEDLASKEKINATNECIPVKVSDENLSYKTLLETYKRYLSYRDWWAAQKRNKYYGFIIKALDVAFHYFSQTLTFFSDAMFNILLNSIEDGIKETQTRVNQNFGSDPTHTQIAKDPPDHPLNNLAGTLAVLAVTNIGIKMQACWSGSISIEEIINDIETNYYTHPKNTDWMDEAVKKWAEQNTAAVRIAESKTAIYHHEKQTKKTLEKYEKEIENIKNPPKKQ